MKIIEREKAAELRKKGLTYPEIMQRLKISKGSLNHWLRDIPYMPTENTREKRRIASINSGMVLHKRKIQRVTQIAEEAKREIQYLKFNELKLLGIMAYWTEGSKTDDSLVQFTNSDPSFIKFSLKWLREICEVQEQKLRLRIRVHSDLDSEKVKNYWSEITNIPISQFHKTTTKISGSNGKGKNKLKYGIATITVCDTNLHYRIKGWINALKTRARSSVE